MRDILRELLPIDIYASLDELEIVDKISELRIRVGKPIRYMLNGLYYTLFEGNNVFYACKRHIDDIMSSATKRSMYAYNNELKRGYISYLDGIRIGVSGEAVQDNGTLITIKNISSLVIRFPKEIKNVANVVIGKIKSPLSNILIVSKPGVGKTTMLRDIVRQISNKGYNITLIDERCEITSMQNGTSFVDIGSNTDVLSNMPKIDAYKLAIRSLNPQMLATDEVFGTDEIKALSDVIRCGVKLIATIHSDSIITLKDSEYSEFLKVFDYIVEISIDNGVRDIKVESNG